MASRRMGPFVLGEQLGAGGMGVVYQATYTKTGQQVAVKFVPSDIAENERIVKRFERELLILKKLRHPSIVRCYGGGLQEGRLFYAMELVDGGSLAGLLKQRGRLSWETSVQYALEICDALEHAHQAGIIHRDLKPANLLLTKKGKLKLSDFGLARDMASTGLSAAGSAQGTYAYIAPEIIRGNPVSHRSDLYSLGCVLFQMLTGRTPFVAESPAEMFFAHVEQKPPRVSTIVLDCPIWLEALVAQLLEKEPERRPRDAGAVRNALREVQRKVFDQSSVMSHSMTGGPSSLSVERDLASVRRVLGTQRSKPAATNSTPIWERAWFLAAALLVIAGLVTWMLWPLGESQLYERAVAAMESDDPLEWKDARAEYLEPYLERFPEGPHVEQMQQFVDQIDMHDAEQRMSFNARLKRPPKSEGERLYAAAIDYENFGDLVTAHDRYKAMIDVLDDQSTDRPYVNLARRRMATIEQGNLSTDRRELVTRALDEADQMYDQGDTLGARTKWQSIVTLYAANRELDPLVARARARLEDPESRNTPAPEAKESNAVKEDDSSGDPAPK